jgi:hypothetical protein
MLEPIKLDKTKSYPMVNLDKENNIFEIRGRSIPEDAIKFYLPILQWVTEYVEDPNPNTEFILDLEYFNSSSAKNIMKMLVILEKILEKGKKIKIIWYYQENDEMIQERGVEIGSVLKIPLEVKSY